MSDRDDQVMRRVRDLAGAATPTARTEALLQGAQRRARTRRTLRLTGAAAAVVTVVAAAALTFSDRGDGADVPIAPIVPRPSASASVDTGQVVQTVRLDEDRLLLVMASSGSGGLTEVLDGSGHRRRLGTLPDPSGYPGSAANIVQALVLGGSWYVLTNDCAGAGVRLYRSDDSGRTWSAGRAIGFASCSAGSAAHLYTVGSGLVLVTKNDNGPGTQVSQSSDGQHWPAQRRSDSGASTLAFQDDGSYVRIWGMEEEPGQTIVKADSLAAAEHRTQLPASADPLNLTLSRSGNGYVVLASNGHAYASSDGRTWTARSAPFPTCECTRRSLTALSGSIWWADAREGRKGHYAITLDAGRSWHAVTGPGSQPRQSTLSFTAWTATSAVVQADDGAWLTRDTGRHWTRITSTVADPSPSVTAQPGDPPNGLPGIPCGADPQGLTVRYHPTDVAIACGDNGIRATQLTWQNWTSQAAKAQGVYVQNDCKPTCLGGHLRQYPFAAFEFRGPFYNDNFSTVVVTFQPGHTGPDGLRRLVRRL